MASTQNPGYTGAMPHFPIIVKDKTSQGQKKRQQKRGAQTSNFKDETELGPKSARMDKDAIEAATAKLKADKAPASVMTYPIVYPTVAQPKNTVNVVKPVPKPPVMTKSFSSVAANPRPNRPDRPAPRGPSPPLTAVVPDVDELDEFPELGAKPVTRKKKAIQAHTFKIYTDVPKKVTEGPTFKTHKDVPKRNSETKKLVEKANGWTDVSINPKKTSKVGKQPLQELANNRFAALPEPLDVPSKKSAAVKSKQATSSDKSASNNAEKSDETPSNHAGSDKAAIKNNKTDEPSKTEIKSASSKSPSARRHKKTRSERKKQQKERKAKAVKKEATQPKVPISVPTVSDTTTYSVYQLSRANLVSPTVVVVFPNPPPSTAATSIPSRPTSAVEVTTLSQEEVEESEPAPEPASPATFTFNLIVMCESYDFATLESRMILFHGFDDFDFDFDNVDVDEEGLVEEVVSVTCATEDLPTEDLSTGLLEASDSDLAVEDVDPVIDPVVESAPESVEESWSIAMPAISVDPPQEVNTDLAEPSVDQSLCIAVLDDSVDPSQDDTEDLDTDGRVPPEVEASFTIAVLGIPVDPPCTEEIEPETNEAVSAEEPAAQAVQLQVDVPAVTVTASDDDWTIAMLGIPCDPPKTEETKLETTDVEALEEPEVQPVQFQADVPAAAVTPSDDNWTIAMLGIPCDPPKTEDVNVDIDSVEPDEKPDTQAVEVQADVPTVVVTPSDDDWTIAMLGIPCNPSKTEENNLNTDDVELGEESDVPPEEDVEDQMSASAPPPEKSITIAEPGIPDVVAQDSRTAADTTDTKPVEDSSPSTETETVLATMRINQAISHQLSVDASSMWHTQQITAFNHAVAHHDEQIQTGESAEINIPSDESRAGDPSLPTAESSRISNPSSVVTTDSGKPISLDPPEVVAQIKPVPTSPQPSTGVLSLEELRAYHTHLGMTSLSDFVTTLITLFGAKDTYTKRDIIGAFAVLSSQEREIIGMPPVHGSADEDEIMGNVVLLHVIKLGHTKLVDFIGPLSFDKGGATLKAVVEAFEEASDKEAVFRESAAGILLQELLRKSA